MPIVSVESGLPELQKQSVESVETPSVLVEESQQQCSILEYYKQANEISMTLFC